MAPGAKMRRRRARGQSLPLIALMIVVLVAMVGLSVDVGNTFQNERRAVSAANAAALAGFNRVIINDGTQKNQFVYEAIIDTLNANGIQISPDGIARNGQLTLDISYIDYQGQPRGSITTDNLGSDIPDNIGFIQVQLEGPVDTYFARVVGRPDLPISANSYAGRCPLGDSVYPIGIDQSLLSPDLQSFQRPDDAELVAANYRTLQTGPYRGMTARKVFVHDGNTNPGNFGFLRWMEDTGQMGRSSTSKEELEASLSGLGNLKWGFDEAPEVAIVGEERTGTYPKDPNQLNVGDWIYGTPGWKVGAFEAPLSEHISNGTQMILPIYDYSDGQGGGDNNGVRFRVSAFGTFVMLAQSTDGNGQSENGSSGGKWFDMVYLGPPDPQVNACQVSNVAPQDSDCCILQGDVSFNPVYGYVPTTARPIQYVIVLDQSGSMSANFKGQCDKGSGTAPDPRTYNVDRANPNDPVRKFTIAASPVEPARFWQCANGPLYDTNGDGDGDTLAPYAVRTTGTGQTYYWDNRDERRISVAKGAIENLIRLTNMKVDEAGTVKNEGYNPAIPEDQMALVYFTDTVSSNGNNETFSTFDSWMNNKFSSNPNDLISKTWSRTTGSDIYRTQGGTNGAAALYRASVILNESPASVDYNGRTYYYQKIVVFITDGVSNQFFHPEASGMRIEQSNWDSYPADNQCSINYKDKKDLVIEDANCQTNRYGGTITRNITVGGQTRTVTLDRPVTQAIKVATENLKGVVGANGEGYKVFVLALSSLPETGLADGIASGSDYYQAVPDLQRDGNGKTNVDNAMARINRIVENDRCQEGSNPPVSWIATNNFDNIAGTDFTYPNIGKVTITNTETGQQYSTEIFADSQSNTLRYFFEKVPPGPYNLSAELYYKNTQYDQLAGNRKYTRLWNGAENATMISVRVSSSSQSGALIPATKQDLQVRFDNAAYDICPDVSAMP